MIRFLSGLFKNNNESDVRYRVDMHSHLLPGIDDGVESLEQSYETITALMSLGYDTFITTPHVMGGVYNNTAEVILEKRDLVKAYLADKNIEVKIEASAEYFLDEHFMELIQTKEKLLPFGDGYVLIETAFMYPSPYLDEAVFLLQASGFKPVLAHPERYLYLHDNWPRYLELHEKGLLFQMNLSSLTGYYSPMVKKVARKLIDEQLIDFVGTDCHGMRHVPMLKKALGDPYLKKPMSLLNHTLQK